MKTYRIFTRDRGRKYSALMPAKGENARAAVRRAKGIDDLKRIPGMVKAIEWPPDAIGQRWLDSNV